MNEAELGRLRAITLVDVRGLEPLTSSLRTRTEI